MKIYKQTITHTWFYVQLDQKILGGLYSWYTRSSHGCICPGFYSFFLRKWWICSMIIRQFKLKKPVVLKKMFSLWPTTNLKYGPHFLCWVSEAVPFNTWPISSCEENKCCYKLIKCTNFLLKMVEVVILSENSCHCVSCSACTKQLVSSQLEISHVLNGTTSEFHHRKWEPKSAHIKYHNHMVKKDLMLSRRLKQSNFMAVKWFLVRRCAQRRTRT